ncbi:GIY-YIG nuclease family protein, partial [Pyruvatibacter sp.]|uniref:GIY-YIG nuclease family protein n=1 Tax=Pyruvatibacter sp. TaxID=1981328 RepID=UPI0032EF70E2
MEKTYYVYILASGRNGTLYVGMTNDIARRAFEHRTGVSQGFTRKYSVHTLVHAEPFSDVREALQRERRLKEWQRAWKLALI